MATEAFADDQYEKYILQQKEVAATLDTQAVREVNPSGAYTPARGIYSLGWSEWQEYPAAGFVKELRDWQLGFYRDHEGDPWYPYFAPVIERGELSVEQMRTWVAQSFFRSDTLSHLEAPAIKRALPYREVRDILCRHVYEESGHGEMWVDFGVKALGMDRVKDLYLAKPVSPKVSGLANFWERLFSSGHFVEVGAALHMYEREVPRAHRRMALGLRKHFGFDGEQLLFFDVHSYIDIYHERFGLYILSKYATTKELQDKARDAFQKAIDYNHSLLKSVYENLPRRK